MKTIRKFLRRLFGPARFPQDGDVWLIKSQFVRVNWTRGRLVGGVREGNPRMENWQMSKRDFRDYIAGATFAARK